MQDKLSWKALEYKRTEKTADWYWAVVIIALSIVVISFLLGDGLFAVFMILATGALLMFAVRPPRWIDIAADSRGLTVGIDSYPFATLEHFWVDISNKNDEKIILKSKKMFLPIIVIPIEEHDHLAVRDFLLKYLPEKELHEPISHKIMERLGF